VTLLLHCFYNIRTRSLPPSPSQAQPPRQAFSFSAAAKDFTPSTPKAAPAPAPAHASVQEQEMQMYPQQQMYAFFLLALHSTTQHRTAPRSTGPVPHTHPHCSGTLSRCMRTAHRRWSVTLLSHCCYTVVCTFAALLLHCPHTVLTLLLHCLLHSRWLTLSLE
jgi:hypothetical protein